MRTRSRLFLCSVACLALILPVGTAEARIEAVKGKQYKLSREHGPWMMMVASFRDVPEDRREDGLSAEEAAAELVYELRLKGIPAYTFRQDGMIQSIDTQDRQGRQDRRIYAAQRDMISVLAGNYPDIEDKVAQASLNYVKKFHPKFLRNKESGGIYRLTPGRPGPLAGAFLTINPLLDPQQVMSRRKDPLLVRLNADTEYSLAEANGRYTLVIATFYGRSATPIGTSSFRGNEASFDKKINNMLDEAAENAWQLTRMLRQKGFDAFVFHDRYQSVVTVGAFDDAQDPRIAKGIEIFGAKMKTDPSTGREVLVSEVLTLPGVKKTDAPYRTWIFDPNPKLMEIPRLR